VIAPVLTGVADDKRTDLAWTPVPGAVKYRLRLNLGTTGIKLYEGPALTFTDFVVMNGSTYAYKVRGIDAKGRLGPWSNVVSLTPKAPVSPPVLAIVGYGAATTGGTGGTVYDVTDFAGYRAALEASGPRIVKLHGSAVFDGAGAEFSVRDGDLTVDGTDWTGSMKDYRTIWRCSNVIVREVAFRPGEGATQALSTDRRAITFNPPYGKTISRIALVHCSFAWGPDVIASFLNNTYDVTMQDCLIGPALYNSNIHNPGEPATGYGPNITTAGLNETSFHVQRITYYRNLMIMNNRRNIRGHDVDGWDAVNNVVYDWGVFSAHGNPRGANVVNNLFKQGPETVNAKGWWSEISGASQSYFPDSVYWTGNVGRTRSGVPLALTEYFAPGVRRATPYDGGPHGLPVIAAADDALFASVVKSAGRTYQDPIDTLIKAHALAGTSDGYYNGAGFPAPHPSWP